jgi:hypothetical protein
MYGLLAMAVAAEEREAGGPVSRGELRGLIRRMAAETGLWGQRRVQAELARLGVTVSARTVAACMRRPYDGVPSPRWRELLTRHAQGIWECDFFSVRTIFFQTLDVFFVMHHGTREIVEARVTRQPTAEWAAQQIVAACSWERDPPRYLIRDRVTSRRCRPTKAGRINSEGPSQPNRPDRRPAGARGPASCV